MRTQQAIGGGICVPLMSVGTRDLTSPPFPTRCKKCLQMLALYIQCEDVEQVGILTLYVQRRILIFESRPFLGSLVLTYHYVCSGIAF